MSLEEEMSNPSDEEIIRILHQRLQTAKEENEYRDNMLCEQIEIWRSNCDAWMNQSNKFEQQNKEMREEKSLDCAMRFENNKGKFVGCLDYIAEINLDRQQMREALENVKFEAEFNGNYESLQKIINIVDNTLKGVE